MILTPIEFLIGLLITMALMAGGSQLFKTTRYRGLAGGIGMLVGMAVIEIYAKVQYGEANPTSLSWIMMRTVLATMLGVVACYLYRESRYREWAAAVGVVFGLGLARIFCF